MSDPFVDKANIRWVHDMIEGLIQTGEYPLLAPLRCTSNTEVLGIIQKHTQGLLADATNRVAVINEIVNLDKNRRFTESAEVIRQINEERSQYEEHQEENLKAGPNVGEELRAMMLKILELTVYTELSGEHSMRIQDVLKEILKERGEEYRL